MESVNHKEEELEKQMAFVGGVDHRHYTFIIITGIQQIDDRIKPRFNFNQHNWRNGDSIGE